MRAEFAAVGAAMRELGVHCQLETLEEAEGTAAVHGTDPEGYNHPRLDEGSSGDEEEEEQGQEGSRGDEEGQQEEGAQQGQQPRRRLRARRSPR